MAFERVSSVITFAYVDPKVLACCVLLVAGASGCSADAVTEPEPTLDTPGAFVAVANDQGTYDIQRTLIALNVGNGKDAVFCQLYAPTAPDFEQARELAKDPELPLADALVLVLKEDVLARDWKVVWFRTLNEEERSVLR